MPAKRKRTASTSSRDSTPLSSKPAPSSQAAHKAQRASAPTRKAQPTPPTSKPGALKKNAANKARAATIAATTSTATARSAHPTPPTLKPSSSVAARVRASVLNVEPRAIFSSSSSFRLKSSYLSSAQTSAKVNSRGNVHHAAAAAPNRAALANRSTAVSAAVVKADTTRATATRSSDDAEASRTGANAAAKAAVRTNAETNGANAADVETTKVCQLPNTKFQLTATLNVPPERIHEQRPEFSSDAVAQLTTNKAITQKVGLYTAHFFCLISDGNLVVF